MSELKVQFSGGLGNQLFTYVAFKHFADSYGKELTLDCSVVERVLRREADILYFRLGGEKIVRECDVSIFDDYFSRISWRNSATRKLTKRMLYPNLNDDFNPAYSFSAKSNRGFFQTSKYYELFRLTHGENFFALNRESERFKILKSEVLEVEPIAIHVRRGDYRDYNNSFGLLESRYFTAAISRLNDLHGERPIWVFSDEPDSVTEEFRKTNLKVSRFVKPSEMNAPETLKLMSLAHSQVISNSTFSWWAGALSKGQRVVYPEPWFKINEGWLRNKELPLSNWVAQKAFWW